MQQKKDNNQNKLYIVLNKLENTDTNLPPNVQKLIDERNNAAEYILTALKTEDTNTNVPASLQKLVDERNNAAANTLVALKPRKIIYPQLSLGQKTTPISNEVIDSQPELIALEPFISQEKLLPSSLQKFIDERNRVINS